MGCNPGVQGGEVWWRLDCRVLDADEQPVNASASAWSSCADTLSNGPRCAGTAALSSLITCGIA